MDAGDGDVSTAQGFQDTLQLGFEHGEIAFDNDLSLLPANAAHVLTPILANRVSIHLRIQANRHFLDFVGFFYWRTADRLKRFRVKRGFFGVKGRMWGLTLATAGFLELGESLANSRRQFIGIAHAANVHEHHFRRVPQKMVVQSGNFDAVIQCGT